jgi:hypothetical protein
MGRIEGASRTQHMLFPAVFEVTLPRIIWRVASTPVATAACRAGALQVRGIRHKEDRRMTRGVHEHILEWMQPRVEADPAVMQRRQQIVEQPCGTIKLLA